MPPSNPGYLLSYPGALLTSTALDDNTYVLYSTIVRQPWMFKFNFGTHPNIATNNKYITAVAYANLSPNDDTLVVTSSSLFGNIVGVCISGGTVNQSYTLTVGVTLNDSTSLSNSMTITIK